MSDRLPDLLADVLADVLEKAAFIFTERAEEPGAWEGSTIQAAISFEAARGGALRLTATRRAAVEIAANMLGLEPADPDGNNLAAAALAEVLNVVGGAFVTRLFGTTAPSVLGIPVSAAVTAPPARCRTCAVAVRTESGDPLLLELDLEGPVTAQG